MFAEKREGRDGGMRYTCAGELDVVVSEVMPLLGSIVLRRCVTDLLRIGERETLSGIVRAWGGGLKWPRRQRGNRDEDMYRHTEPVVHMGMCGFI